MVIQVEKPIKVSVIIINWNGGRFIERCLDSILASDTGGYEYEIIVGDNASSDNSVSLIKDRFSGVRLLEFKENYGFCKGNNMAASHARGEYLFFLNNDTRIEPWTIRKMVDTIEGNNRIGICGCKMVNYNGSVVFHTGIGSDFLGYPVRNRRPFYIEGSAFMIKKELFDRLGGFDEDYFMFHEDIDLSWRVQISGYDIGVSEEALVYHYLGANAGGGECALDRGFVTTTFRRYHCERNNITTLLKNYSLIYLLLILPVYFLISLAELFIFTITGRPSVVKAYLRAYWWNIRNIKKTLRKRIMVQRDRKLADSQILSRMSKIPGKFFVLREFGFPKIKDA